MTGGIVGAMATLTRSNNKMIGGVCAGIAERYGWKTRNVRIAFVLSGILPGPQFVIYLVLWAVLPKPPSAA